MSAIDAIGSYLWVVTDSTVAKRTVTDTTIIASFNYRPFIGPDYYPTGFAVDTGYCLLMTVSPINYRGKLLRFSLDGSLLGSVETSGVLKDLSLVNGRLFCVGGDETFYELNTATGRVTTNYNLLGRPFGNNIGGIAFTGKTIQLASADPVARFSTVNIPRAGASCLLTSN